VRRLTNAFSKKIENDAHSLAMFTIYCTFVRECASPPMMPLGSRIGFGILGDIVNVVEAAEPKPAKRGRYKKRVVAA
jgi:hypothetical protein